jgi:hypothetical protein
MPPSLTYLTCTADDKQTADIYATSVSVVDVSLKNGLSLEAAVMNTCNISTIALHKYTIQAVEWRLIIES